MIPADKRESGQRAHRAGHDRWGVDDDDVEGARNWAVLLLYVPLMTVPFLAVAWFLS
ncbi:MAG: hypothetical protein K0M55_20150 [Rhizobium sp.]|nr:hypothetical protein [Rhizobium sp.]MBW8320965.1 hypothetical protein [Rhizobium sp.]MBW8446685.1 hypothetical protein [Arenimonas sp.]